MSREVMNVKETAERNQSLLLLTASPVIWAAHFLLSYITASIWCSKATDRDGSFWYLLAAITIFTAVALFGIGVVGWNGYRRHSLPGGEVPHDDDTPEDRHRFLGFSTLLLSAMSGIAVLYAGFVVIFFRSCD